MISRNTSIEAALKSKQRGMLLNPFRFGAASGGFPTTGLVAYYRLQGDANDATPAGRNAISTTGISYAAAKNGNGGVFTAATPVSITLPNTAKLPDDYTIAAWVKASVLNPPSGAHVLYADWSGGGRNILVVQVAGGNIEYTNGNGGSLSDPLLLVPGVLNTSTYTFVAIRRIGSTISLWKDGALAATYVGAYSGSTTGNNWRIGADNSNSASFGFDGIIDELGLWDIGLSPTQLTNLYNAGAGLFY